jgi:hypothetical protein
MQQPPESDRVENNKWQRIVKTVEGDKSHNKFVKKLTAGTYLIDVPDGLPFLGLGIYQSDQEGLHYSIGLLPEPPNMQGFHHALSEAPTKMQQ